MACILVVDSDVPHGRAIQRLLLPSGHAVFTAGQSDGAIRRLQNGIYQLVLLDLSMPAAEAVQAVAAQQKPPPTCIGMSTPGSLAPSMRALCARLPHPVLPKPVAEETLLAAVRTALRANTRWADGLRPDKCA